MDPEEEFYIQLAKSIQTWLWVEGEIYLLYASIMKGSNSHLVSVTFHYIESFDSKLGLIDSCYALYFTKDSEHWKSWRTIQNKARKLNAKRNKIVHQPVKTGYADGEEIIEISPSFMNALALSKGQTTYHGQVINKDYKPSMAKLTDDHKIDFRKLRGYEREFRDFSYEVKAFREEVTPLLEEYRKDYENGRSKAP